MEKISTSSELQRAITQLEIKQAGELTILKQELRTVGDSLKPINMVKGAFKEIVNSPDLKSNIMNLALGLAKGFVDSKIPFVNASGAMTKIADFIIRKVSSKK